VASVHDWPITLAKFCNSNRQIQNPRSQIPVSTKNGAPHKAPFFYSSDITIIWPAQANKKQLAELANQKQLIKKKKYFHIYLTLQRFSIRISLDSTSLDLPARDSKKQLVRVKKTENIITHR
jgi:hypothetical protein